MMHKLTFDGLREKFMDHSVEISGWIMYENNKLDTWMDIYDCNFNIDYVHTGFTMKVEQYDGLDVAMLVVPILINNYDMMEIELMKEPYPDPGDSL